MDVSKLPKLSGEKSDANSASPAEPAAPPTVSADSVPPPAHPLSYTAAAPGFDAEIWFSAIIGLIFLALGWPFGKYLAAVVSHQPFHTQVQWQSGPLAGTEVNYWDLQGGVAVSDSAVFLFGIALIIDAICLVGSSRIFGGRHTWVLLSLAIMFGAVAYNAVVCVQLLNLGITPILSLLAVALGGYSIFYQWAILRSLKRSAQRPQGS